MQSVKTATKAMIETKRIERDPLKVGHCLKNPTSAQIRELARHDERTTEFGSASYIAKYKSRAADFTRTTVDQTLTDEDLAAIEQAKQYLASARMIRLDRSLGQKNHIYHCRLYVSERYARLALMFRHSLGDVSKVDAQPDFITVDIPEFPGDRRILVDTITGMTFVLGSDYYGEIKKSFLRQFMYAEKMKGHLGLHAGSKEVWARSRITGEIVRKGLFFFGLSGTGKTSLTCHEYGVDESVGEHIRVRQDDVVSLHEDGFCAGSEPEGFYIKTEGLNPVDQKALFDAARSPETLFENVSVAEDGRVNFDDPTISKNGRAIVPIRKVMFTDGDIDMPEANAAIFITRNPLVPPIVRLTQEQAAAAFMLGESIKTSAADPNAKGEPVREVGTNPFIVGPVDEEGNRFLEILKKNPKIQCYLLNTGSMGYGERKRKISILETVSMIRELCRDGIEWEYDQVMKFEVPKKIEGVDEKLFRISNYFAPGELETKLEELRAERSEWLKSFANLKPEIRAACY